MLKKTIAVLAAGIGLSIASIGACAATTAELAFRYAPVHYQDTDSSDYPSE